MQRIRQLLQSLVSTRRRQGYLLAVPAFLILLLILVCAVNMPFWDEWELVPIFQHLQSGHFYWQDFWLQHNEHRLLFPNLILVGFAHLTGWNTVMENILSLGIACGSFFALYKATRLQEKGGSTAFFIVLATLSLLWFSPSQVENWLWGWQLEWYLSVLGVMLAIYGLTRVIAGHSARSGIAFIIGGTILAQFSLGNGMLLWPILTLALLYLRKPLWLSLTAAVAGTVATTLYFHKFSNVHSTSWVDTLRQPVRFMDYLLQYLGRSLSPFHKPAILVGFVGIVIFISISVYLFVKEKKLFRQALPWISLCLYVLGSAAITAIARLDLAGDVVPSRYITISMLWWVGFLLLCWTARRPLWRYLKPYSRVVAISAGIFILMIAMNGAWGVRAAKNQHSRLEAIHACTSLPDPTNDCLLMTYPNAPLVDSRLEYIKSRNWGGYLSNQQTLEKQQ